MNRVRERALHSEAVELSIRLKLVSQTLEEGSLCFRSASRQLGMEEIVLAVVLGGSEACSAGMLWSLQRELTGRSEVGKIRWGWVRIDCSQASIRSFENLCVARRCCHLYLLCAGD